MEYRLKALDKRMQFKEFILDESKAFFAQRVSDILSALQDLNDNAEDMGPRHLVSNAETIVNQIRRTIHTHWPDSERSNLTVLQKCGVAIMKAIEEKGELKDVLKAVQQQMESISGEAPVNDIGPSEEEPEDEN
jgi:hypothetical protein